MSAFAVTIVITFVLTVGVLGLRLLLREESDRGRTSTDYQLFRAAGLLYRIQALDKQLAALPEDLRDDLDKFLLAYDRSLRSQ